jgi:hypothetical protein
MVARRKVLRTFNVFKAGLQAQTALFELAQFLVAGSHVVKHLERVGLVAGRARHINDLDNAMRFLK